MVRQTNDPAVERDFYLRLLELVAAEDPEPLLGQLARTGLQNLTSQDFGPAADAAPAERAEAVAEWKAWRKNHP